MASQTRGEEDIGFAALFSEFKSKASSSDSDSGGDGRIAEVVRVDQQDEPQATGGGETASKVDGLPDVSGGHAVDDGGGCQDQALPSDLPQSALTMDSGVREIGLENRSEGVSSGDSGGKVENKTIDDSNLRDKKGNNSLGSGEDTYQRVTSMESKNEEDKESPDSSSDTIVLADDDMLEGETNADEEVSLDDRINVPGNERMDVDVPSNLGVVRTAVIPRHMSSPAASSGGGISSCQSSPSSSISSSATHTSSSSPITTPSISPVVLSRAASKLARPAVTARVHPKPEKPNLRDRSGRKRNNSLDSEFVTNFPTRKERPKSSTPKPPKSEDAKKPRPRVRPAFPKERTQGKPKPKVVRPGIQFEVGFRLEAMDSYQNKWYLSRIVQVEEREQMILVHFDKWNSRFDEWIDCDSTKIRPMRLKTKGKLKGKKRLLQQVHQVPRPAEAVGSAARPPPTVASPQPQPQQLQQPQQQQQQSEPSDMVGDFRYGEEVLARWSDCRYYPAKVLSLNKNETYRMLFYDGIEKNVLGTNTRTMPDELKQMNFFSNFNLPPAPVVKGKKRWSAKDQNIPEPTTQEAATTSSEPPTSPRPSKRRLSDTTTAPLSPPLAKKAKIGEKLRSPKLLSLEPSKSAEVEVAVKSPKQKVMSPRADVAMLPLPQVAAGLDVKPVLEPVLPPAKREEILSRNIKEPLLNDKALGLLKNRPTQLLAPKELVIDLDHNKYKCNFKDCDKSFRKQSLLEYHKKYYHATKTRASTAATRVLSRTKKMIKESGKIPSKISPRKRLSAPPDLVSSYRSGEKTPSRRPSKLPASVPRRRQSLSPPPVVSRARQRHQSEPILARGGIATPSPMGSPTEQAPPLAKVIEGVDSAVANPPQPPPEAKSLATPPDATPPDAKPQVESDKSGVERVTSQPAKRSKAAAGAASSLLSSDVQKPREVPKLVEKKVWEIAIGRKTLDRGSRVPKKISKNRTSEEVRSQVIMRALHGDNPIPVPVKVPITTASEAGHRHRKHKRDKERKRQHKKRKKEERRQQLQQDQQQLEEAEMGPVREQPRSESDGGDAGNEEQMPLPASPGTGTFKQPHSRVSVRHSGGASLTGASNEIVKCVCKITEENGFMIQCEDCYCWQHSTCMGLSVRTVPKRYTCYYCQIEQGHKPPLFDQEDYAWYERGELPMMPNFRRRGKRPDDPRAASLRQATNSLMGDMITLIEVLQGLQHKIAILQNPKHPEALLWAKDWILRSQKAGMETSHDQSESSATSTPRKTLSAVLSEVQQQLDARSGSSVELISPVAGADDRSDCQRIVASDSSVAPTTTPNVAKTGSEAVLDGRQLATATSHGGETSLGQVDGISDKGEATPQGGQSTLKSNTTIITADDMVDGKAPLTSSSSPGDGSSTTKPQRDEIGPADASGDTSSGKSSIAGAMPLVVSASKPAANPSDRVARVATTSGHFVVKRATGPIAEHNYVATRPRSKVHMARIGQPKTTFDRPSLNRRASSEEGGGKEGKTPAARAEAVEVSSKGSREDEGVTSGSTLSADEKTPGDESSQKKPTSSSGLEKMLGSEVTTDQEPSVELSQGYLLRHINTMHDQLSERLTLIEMEVEKLEKMFADASAEWRADSEDSTALRKKMRVLLGDLQKIETIVSF